VNHLEAIGGVCPRIVHCLCRLLRLTSPVERAHRTPPKVQQAAGVWGATWYQSSEGRMEGLTQDEERGISTHDSSSLDAESQSPEAASTECSCADPSCEMCELCGELSKSFVFILFFWFGNQVILSLLPYFECRPARSVAVLRLARDLLHDALSTWRMEMRSWVCDSSTRCSLDSYRWTACHSVRGHSHSLSHRFMLRVMVWLLVNIVFKTSSQILAEFWCDMTKRYLWYQPLIAYNHIRVLCTLDYGCEG
jgi:hypothetical protein